MGFTDPSKHLIGENPPNQIPENSGAVPRHEHESKLKQLEDKLHDACAEIAKHTKEDIDKVKARFAKK